MFNVYIYGNAQTEVKSLIFHNFTNFASSYFTETSICYQKKKKSLKRSIVHIIVYV